VSCARITRRAPALFAPACAAAILIVGCASPEPKVWNLDQLHDGETRHRYQAALQGDFGWFMRHGLLGLFQGAGAQFAADQDAEPVEDPAGECLTNLLELEERALALEGVDARHIEWFARIAVEDRSRLSRERAVIALGRLGQRLSVGLPARLGADQKPAGPNELAPILEELVRSVRVLVEALPEKKSSSEGAVAQQVTAVRALDLDLAAGRRALRATSELQRLLATAELATRELDELVVHLENLLVRRALAAAIEDTDEIVRAAAVHGIAASGGARAIDVVLFDRFRREKESRPLRALLEVLTASGLPDPVVSGVEITHSREEWITSIHVIAIQHPDGELRVRAMRTLQAVAAPELASLREEDWQAWLIARREASQRKASQPVDASQRRDTEVRAERAP